MWLLLQLISENKSLRANLTIRVLILNLLGSVVLSYSNTESLFHQQPLRYFQFTTRNVLAKFSAILGGRREQVKYPSGFSRWSMMAPRCIVHQGKSTFSLCNICAHMRGANSQSETSKPGWRISWNILPQEPLFWNRQFLHHCKTTSGKLSLKTSSVFPTACVLSDIAVLCFSLL